MLKKLNSKGFIKLLLIPGILILLVVLFVLQDVFLAPPDKKMFFQQPLESATNHSSAAPSYTPSNYKNNLTLNWTPVVLTKAVSTPTMGFPPLDQNENVYQVKDITYCTVGNKSLVLDLYSDKPPTPGSQKPMVVYLHGGGFVEGDKEEFDYDVTRVLLSLVNNGFIVASVNYRYAPEYKFPAEIQDAVCAMRFLRYYSYGIGANQNKIGTFGDSTGGQLSSLVGATSGLESFENTDNESIAGANLTEKDYLKIPSKPNAVVNYYGGTNLPDNWLGILISKQIGGEWHGKNGSYSLPGTMQEVYNFDATLMHEASAIHYITAGEPPFLIVQGDKDYLTPPQQAAVFYNKLKSYNSNDVTLLVVKNGDHRFVPNPPDATMDPSFDSIINTTVDFFKSHLE